MFRYKDKVSVTHMTLTWGMN